MSRIAAGAASIETRQIGPRAVLVSNLRPQFLCAAADMARKRFLQA